MAGLDVEPAAIAAACALLPASLLHEVRTAAGWEAYFKRHPGVLRVTLDGGYTATMTGCGVSAHAEHLGEALKTLFYRLNPFPGFLSEEDAEKASRGEFVQSAAPPHEHWPAEKCKHCLPMAIVEMAKLDDPALDHLGEGLGVRWPELDRFWESQATLGGFTLSYYQGTWTAAIGNDTSGPAAWNAEFPEIAMLGLYKALRGARYKDGRPVRLGDTVSGPIALEHGIFDMSGVVVGLESDGKIGVAVAGKLDLHPITKNTLDAMPQEQYLNGDDVTIVPYIKLDDNRYIVRSNTLYIGSTEGTLPFIVKTDIVHVEPYRMSYNGYERDRTAASKMAETRSTIIKGPAEAVHEGA